MKYIFCIVALLAQPIMSWYVYHKQDKRSSALKIPMLFYCGVYFMIQIFVFVKYCMKFSERYQIWSYLIQAIILVIFIILELVLLKSNQYINNIETKERSSIRDFKDLIAELEICRLGVSEINNQMCIDNLLEKMKVSDPVSSPSVEEENERIHELIAGLKNITEKELFQKQCDEISKQLQIRKIKNMKERG